MASISKKKVLVVDDSAFMRKVITDILNSHPQIEVIGTARNGVDALEKFKSLAADVITLDVEMPLMNGLETLEEIMKIRPTPVVMLSSTTGQGADNTLLAMEAGAIDFILKPGGAISLNLTTVKEEIIEKVLAAASVKMTMVEKINKQSFPNKQTGIQGRDGFETVQRKSFLQVKNETFFSPANKTIVAIGTSTGGPRALQEVLVHLPKNIKAPIVIVQHMPVGFTKSLAERLNKLSEIDVKEVENDDILKDGVAYIAPGGKHFKVQKVGASLVAKVNDVDPPISGHRPSVDVLFQSIAHLPHIQCLAIVMTGMGNDGMHGLIELKKNCPTIAIAESHETCVVYGMPKAIVDKGLADEVMRLEEIASSITEKI